jgi:uncharacterized protein with HEPN domain
MFRLIQISENAKLITNDFKKTNPKIEWKGIIGLRNKIVHEYGEVDLHIIFDTIVVDIPWLKNDLCSLL